MKKLFIILLSLLSFGAMAQHGNFTDIRLINGSAGLAGTNNGTIYFNPGSGLFQFRQGGAWLGLGNITGSFTSGRIPFTTGSGSLSDSPNLTFNGSNAFTVSATGIVLNADLGGSNSMSLTASGGVDVAGKVFLTRTATLASLSLGVDTGDPSFLANSDMWYNSTTNHIYARINGSSYQLDQQGSGTVTGTGTTNELAYWTSSTALGALAVATYPSLTELALLKGVVTTPVQTQIDSKIDGTMASTRIPYGVDANTVASEAAFTYDATLNNILLANAGGTASSSLFGGELQFDDISASDDLTINNAGISSTGNAALTIANNSGNILLNPTGTVSVTGIMDVSGAAFISSLSIGDASATSISSTSSIDIKPSPNNSPANVTIEGSNAVSGNNNGGDVVITGGTPQGSGIRGGIALNMGTGNFTIGSVSSMNRSVLVGGTVVVGSTKVTANSNILLTCQIPGGTVGAVYISARTGGTSFTITSTSALDTSTIAWLIIEP